MNFLLKIIIIFVAAVLLSIPANAYGPDPEQKKSTCTPFSNFGENTLNSFTGSNLFLHTVGIISTGIVIYTKTDFHIHRYFAGNMEYNPYTIPAVWAGYTLPLVLGGSLCGYGKIKQDSETLTAGCAVLQSTIISTIYVGVLKTITGRPNPDPHKFSDMRKASRRFRFGFMRGGVHYGWPSGHLTVNTAAVTSLLYFYPHSAILKIIGGVYLVYMIFGVSAHNGATMHWFSDVIAGTIFGFTIGSTVGKNFHQTYKNHIKTNGKKENTLSPVFSLSGIGLNFRINF